jgi:hypothetical protein
MMREAVDTCRELECRVIAKSRVVRELCGLPCVTHEGFLCVGRKVKIHGTVFMSEVKGALTMQKIELFPNRSAE